MHKPIHTYLDLDVVNNNLNSSTNAPQLRFEENRNTPFWKETAASLLLYSQVLHSDRQLASDIHTQSGDRSRTDRHKQDGRRGRPVGGRHAQ